MNSHHKLLAVGRVLTWVLAKRLCHDTI